MLCAQIVYAQSSSHQEKHSARRSAKRVGEEGGEELARGVKRGGRGGRRRSREDVVKRGEWRRRRRRDAQATKVFSKIASAPSEGEVKRNAQFQKNQKYLRKSTKPIRDDSTKKKDYSSQQRKPPVRVTFKGEGFGTDVSQIHVTINGITAPGIVLHDRSTISFEIPRRIWENSSVLRQSVLKVSVGREKKLRSLPMMSLMDFGGGGGGKLREEQREEEERRERRTDASRWTRKNFGHEIDRPREYYSKGNTKSTEQESPLSSGAKRNASGSTAENSPGVTQEKENSDRMERGKEELDSSHPEASLKEQSGNKLEKDDANYEAMHRSSTNDADMRTNIPREKAPETVKKDMRRNMPKSILSISKVQYQEDEGSAANSQDHASKSSNLTSTASKLLAVNEPKENREAVSLLKEAAKLGDDKAMVSLGASHLAGDIPGISRDIGAAARWLEQASQKGNPDAQALMGLLYATGLARDYNITRSIPKAILEWRFAARGGSTFAQMALANRHLSGVDVEESCATASVLYENVAKEVVSTYNAELRRPGVSYSMLRGIMPPSAKRFLFSDRARLSSDYSPDRKGEFDEILQFYRYTGGKEDGHAQFIIGIMNYHGANGVPQDYAKAKEAFQLAANAGNSEAEAHLGLIEMNLGNHISAYFHFKKANEGENVLGTEGLAYCLLHGLGTKKDVEKAAEFYRLCAMSKSTDSMFNYGILTQLGIGVPQSSQKAFRLFQGAAEEGHFLARYIVGSAYLRGFENVVDRDCTLASQFLKSVSERRTWYSIISKGLKGYEKGDYDIALYRYLQAAHAGIELGQYNAAFLYDQGLVGRSWSLSTDNKVDRKEEVDNAMQLYEMSARQGYDDSMIRKGDLAYTELKNYDLAANVYTKASKSKNPEAVFNLGWMHWWGLGVRRDMHLAKRYFNLAAEFDRNAIVPAMLADRVLLLYTTWQKYSKEWKHWTKVSNMSSFAVSMEIIVVTTLLGILAIIVNLRHRRMMHFDNQVEALEATETLQEEGHEGGHEEGLDENNDIRNDR